MLLRDAKVLVACERAAGSRHHHRARVRAARDDGCHVRIADHAELRRGDAIKRDLGCAGQSLSENFSGLIDLGARLNEGDERTKTGVKTIDGACETICVRPVEHAVRPLHPRSGRVVKTGVCPGVNLPGESLGLFVVLRFVFAYGIP